MTLAQKYPNHLAVCWSGHPDFDTQDELDLRIEKLQDRIEAHLSDKVAEIFGRKLIPPKPRNNSPFEYRLALVPNGRMSKDDLFDGLAQQTEKDPAYQSLVTRIREINLTDF